MRKWGLRLLRTLYVGLIACLPIAAFANYQAGQCSSSCVNFASTVVAAVHYAQMMLTDSTGVDVSDTTNHAIKVNVVAGGAGGGAVTNAGTFATQLTGATNNINNIAGTVSLPTGAATSAKQPALGTAGTPSTDVLSSQGNASNAADAVATGAISVPGLSYNMMYNGTTWDRLRGDTTNGAWVNVKNANANGRAVSGSASPVVPTPALTTWHLIAANSTNATSVKGSATTLFSCQLGNNSTNIGFLKIYNKATSPTVGTDVPVKTLIIPGPSAGGGGSNISFGPGGLTLATGFAAAVTGVITDADTTAVAATAFAINCDYE